jgi:hypothetical protein
MNVCGHPRVQQLGRVVVCLDCDHSWDEHPGELEFADGQIAGLAFVLITPRDERRDDWASLLEPSCKGRPTQADQHSSHLERTRARRPL